MEPDAEIAEEEAPEADPVAHHLKRVTHALGTAIGLLTLGYCLWVMTPLHDPTWRAIWRARVKVLAERHLGCCAPCRRQRRVEREVVWEARAIVEGIIP